MLFNKQIEKYIFLSLTKNDQYSINYEKLEILLTCTMFNQWIYFEHKVYTRSDNKIHIKFISFKFEKKIVKFL